MDYKVVSQQVVDNVGGLENIEGATHCVTRLRLVLKDTSKYNKAELENIDGVKGVLYNSGQLMIIFGTGTVNKVYDEFMALTGVKEIERFRGQGRRGGQEGQVLLGPQGILGHLYPHHSRFRRRCYHHRP